MNESNRELYKNAGVDVEKGDGLVSWLNEKNQENVASSKYGEVVSGIGGFSALFRPNFSQMKDPLLVSGTDGVGTKVLLGLEHNAIQGLGIDLVAMCVNDLYTIGGRPLFFLDYYATGTLNSEQFKQVLTGIKLGLKQADTLLLGGETAELPGLYANNHFDIAGFVVGVVDGEKKLGAENVKHGDLLYAFESSGFHSNGYSLLRSWVTKKSFNDATIAKLLEPTKIYYEWPKILDAIEDNSVHAVAHITGGGISGNITRVLPEGATAVIKQSDLPTPDWMQAIFHDCDASFEMVEGIFNMGVGMISCVDPAAKTQFEALAKSNGIKAHPIGYVDYSQTSGQPRVVYN
jgi:phosphoribosylformylglycinamidine cyclo-ligase